MATLIAWFLQALPAIAAFVALTVGVALGVVAWRARRESWRDALRATIPDGVLVIALGAIAILTLGDPMGPQPDRINLIPFRDQWWALQGQVDPALASSILLTMITDLVGFGGFLLVAAALL